MKIIMFSDIHANLPALEAFFAHAERHEADVMYCLGDLVGYNIWPDEGIAKHYPAGYADMLRKGI